MSKIRNLLFSSNDKSYSKHASETLAKVLDEKIKYKDLSNDEIKDKFKSIKQNIINNTSSINDVLPEVFALVAIMSKRILKMDPYDVQIKGAIVLHEGNVAEMRTGEGKTLTATMPIILNAISGNGVHVVTVNEYLAKRDIEELKPLYEFFDLTVGLNINSKSPDQKREAYNADILYTTATELGFDYLRDNMVKAPNERVNSKPRNFALIDEVDSILIDEARTPLIIAQDSNDGFADYINADKFAKSLVITDYYIDLEAKVVFLSKDGEEKANKFFHVESIYDSENTEIMHRIAQAMHANLIQKLDVDYAIKQNDSNNKEIVIIDQFTGRIMPGRRFNDGLHQALEAKHLRDGVTINPESVTSATITLQNFFRLYKKLAGMSGTAKTEEEEFTDIYNMRVIEIETNKPSQRKDHPLALYTTKKSKWLAIINKIKKLQETGQPLLVGTASVEDSEYLSKLLKAEKIPHVVLNAKQDQNEAETIAKAGKRGSITIATNMAGRGTDIKLTDDVKDLGGLFVLSTELNESRRIDNQLKGRAGRQGDPGETVITASLEDDLFKRFGSKKIQERLKATMTEGFPLPLNRTLSNLLTESQKRVEGQTFDARKSTLQYDDIVREQRTIYYEDRQKVVDAKSLDDLMPHIKKVTTQISSNEILRSKSDWDDWKEHHPMESLTEVVIDTFKKMDQTSALNTAKAIILSAMDSSWIKHIDALEQLRSGISYRSYAGGNPIIAYQNESAQLYDELINNIYRTEGQNYFRLKDYKSQKPTDIYDNQFSKTVKGSNSKQSMKNYARTM